MIASSVVKISISCRGIRLAARKSAADRITPVTIAYFARRFTGSICCLP